MQINYSVPKEITELLRLNLLTFTEGELNEMYKRLAEEGCKNISDKCTTANLKGIYKEWGENPESDCLQIDLPILWKSTGDNPNPKTIMIVGMDPMSSEKSKKYPKEVLLNTAYSFQYERSRKNPNHYSKLILQLLKKCNVYTTDVYKLFFLINDIEGKTKKKSNKELKYTKQQIHQNLLDAEILKIKPDIIVSFESIAKKSCLFSLNKNTYNENNLISLPHPQAYEKYWRNFFKVNFNNEFIAKAQRPDFFTNFIMSNLK